MSEELCQVCGCDKDKPAANETLRLIGCLDASVTLLKDKLPVIQEITAMPVPPDFRVMASYDTEHLCRDCAAMAETQILMHELTRLSADLCLCVTIFRDSQ